MDISIEKLRKIHQDWSTRKIKFEAINSSVAIQTPFVDMYHDNIELYLESVANKYRITDDGYTIDELSTLGVDIISSKTRNQFFERLLSNFGVSFKETTSELFIEFSSLDDFPLMQNRLIQCVIQVSDLLFTTRQKVLNLFNEEVANFFLDNDISINENQSMRGLTGNDFNFDFTIGRTRNTPPKAIKLVNNPTASAYESPLLSIIDVKPLRNETEFYVIANDTEKKIASSFISSLNSYEIPVLAWKQRNDWIDNFKLG